MREDHYEAIFANERTHWWYRVRRQLVRFLLHRHVPGSHPRVLDVGCGTGLLLQELSEHYDVTGIDMSPQALALCKERGLTNVSLGSATAMNFPDRSFDAILLLDVLEHIEDDNVVAKEMYRVLKPGGVAIVFVPAFQFLWGVTDEASKHFRRYTRPHLKSVLGQAGFGIVRATYFNFFLFTPIALVRLMARMQKHSRDSEFDINNRYLNGMLYAIFHLESLLLRFINFPFGVSLCMIVRKSPSC